MTAHSSGQAWFTIAHSGGNLIRNNGSIKPFYSNLNFRPTWLSGVSSDIFFFCIIDFWFFLCIWFLQKEIDPQNQSSRLENPVGVFTDHLKGQGLTHSDRAEFRCQRERGLSQISQAPSEEGGRGRKTRCPIGCSCWLVSSRGPDPTLGCGRKAAFTLRVKHQYAQTHGIIIGTLTIIFVLFQVWQFSMLFQCITLFRITVL